VRDLLGVPAPDDSQRHRFRWEPSRRSVAALGVVLVVAVAATWWWVTSSRSGSVPVTVAPPASGSMSASAPTASAVSRTSASATPSPATIVVDVAGKVARPGIYRLPADSRVFDAVRAAGGAKPGVDTVTINLAAPLQDGQQVVVGTSGAPAPPGPVGSGSSSVPTVVDLNTASLEELETLPGVGPVLGQHILDWRSEHGRFDSIDQLNEVSGIGEVTFAELRGLVTT
jgi:competence protein ComEA